MAIGMLSGGAQMNQAWQFRRMHAEQAAMNGAAGYGYGESAMLSPRARMEATYDRSYQNWSQLSYRDPSQGFAQRAGQMQAQESEMFGQSVQQYGALKEDLFQSHHYQYTPNGPVLVGGKESMRDKAMRMQYERRQAMRVENQFANHPLQGRIRQLEQQALMAVQSGQNPTQALLELDAAKTRFGIDKARALMNATMPPGDSDDVRALRDFGNGALNDYQSMHAENMQQLAADPSTQAYLASLGQQYQQRANNTNEMRRRAMYYMGN